MRLSATGRCMSEFTATARWTCAMPPIPSCSYTMYGPNRSVGEPSLTPTWYQASITSTRETSGLSVPSPRGRDDHPVDQQQRGDRHHELDRRWQELDTRPGARWNAQGREHRDRR